MKKSTIKKLIIVAVVFVLAAVVTLIVLNLNKGGEVSYTVTPPTTLPVVSLEADGVSINTLYGYTDRDLSDDAYESITPLANNHKLPIKIKTPDSKITGISYEIRSLDGSDLIEQTKVDEMSESGGVTTATLPIKDILDDGIEYRLIIIVDTEETQGISYYTRVVYGKNYKVNEMMEYVSDFHASTFNATAAAKYAVNWEVDETMDAGTLAHVNIHSTFDQLTYSDLAPTETEGPIITILEMDETFGSFKVDFLLSATDENGEETQYCGEEFFCVQWSELRFYLMSYDRYMTQIFEANNSTIKEGGLYLGVADKSSIAVTKSPSEEYTAFVDAGDLWTYSATNSEMVEVFSEAENRDNIYRAKRDYNIRVVDVTDEGNVSFIVCGYMNSGAHEGKSGLSYMIYNKSKNVIDEILFINTEQNYETIEAGLDTLLSKKSEKTYFLCDDAIYEVDESAGNATCILENAALHGLKVSEEGIALAWCDGADLDFPSELQVKYLETDTGFNVTAPSGEYIKAVGFSGTDFAYTRGRESDACVYKLEKINPAYALEIVDNTGAKITTYEKTGIMISSVKVEEGQVVIDRLEKTEGSYKDIGTDALMQNANVVEEKESPFETKTVSIRGEILVIKDNNAKSKSNFRITSPGQISYYNGELVPQTKDNRTLFYAYSLGHLQAITEEANDAISAAYDDMGYVTATGGYRVWHRKAKDTISHTINIPEISDGITDEMEGALTAIITKAGGSADVKGQLAEGKSAREILDSCGKGISLKLDGCTLKNIYTFIERGYPVLALNTSDEPILIVGYDSYNLIAYNPTTQENYYIGEEDAKEQIETDGSHMLALLW